MDRKFSGRATPSSLLGLNGSLAVAVRQGLEVEGGRWTESLISLMFVRFVICDCDHYYFCDVCDVTALQDPGESCNLAIIGEMAREWVALCA